MKKGIMERTAPSEIFIGSLSSLKSQALNALAQALGSSLEHFTEPRMFCSCSYICHFACDYLGFTAAIKSHSLPMYLLSKFPIVNEAVLSQIAAMFKGDFEELCNCLNQAPTASSPQKRAEHVAMERFFDVSSIEVSKIDPLDTTELVIKYFTISCNFLLPSERYATREYLSAIRFGAKLALNNDDVISVLRLPKTPDFELKSWLDMCYDPKIVVHLPFKKQGKNYVDKAFFFSVYNTVYPHKITIAIGNNGKKKKEHFFDDLDDDADVVCESPLEKIREDLRNAEYEI